MTCLDVTAERLNAMVATLEVGKLSSADFEAKDNLSGEFVRQENLLASASVSDRLTATFAVICSASNAAFLEVTPTEIQWITIDNPVVFHVHSNTKWKIE